MILQKKEDICDLPYDDKLSSDEGIDGGVPSTGGSVPQEIPSNSLARIERHLADKLGQLMISHGDKMRIHALLDEGIPELMITSGIDFAFTKFRPKYPSDRIRSVSYCEPLIREMYYRSKETLQGQEEKSRSFHRTSMPGTSQATNSAHKRNWDEFEYRGGEA